MACKAGDFTACFAARSYAPSERELTAPSSLPSRYTSNLLVSEFSRNLTKAALLYDLSSEHVINSKRSLYMSRCSLAVAL